MLRSLLGSVMLAIAPAWLGAQQPLVPHPREVLGFTPGDDYQIADYPQMLEYFRRLDAVSDRVRVQVVGKTTQGRDMIVAVITAEANFARLDRYKEIARKLAFARDLSEDQARELAKEGKAIVWIDSGLHALETAHAQHAFLLAHREAGRVAPALHVSAAGGRLRDPAPRPPAAVLGAGGGRRDARH